MHHLELLICTIVAVATLARAHGVVSGPVKNRCQRVLNQIRWHQFRVQRIRIGWRLAEFPIRNVPYCAPAHDHVPRRGAHATHPRAHLVCAINYHALSRQFFDDRSIQLAAFIVELKIKRRLIVDDDVEDVGALLLLFSGRAERQNQRCKYKKCELFHGNYFGKRARNCLSNASAFSG